MLYHQYSIKIASGFCLYFNLLDHLTNWYSNKSKYRQNSLEVFIEYWWWGQKRYGFVSGAPARWDSFSSPTGRKAQYLFFFSNFPDSYQAVTFFNCHFCSYNIFTGLIVVYLDIDECILGLCQANAICNNTIGSYNCTCISGYDGGNCTGKWCSFSGAMFCSWFIFAID